MKTKNTTRALVLFVISIITALGATTASAGEAVKHPFNWDKTSPQNLKNPEADAKFVAQMEGKGWRVLTGEGSGYTGNDCWNGTTPGYAKFTKIEANTEYWCDSKGVPCWKRSCGNQIEIIEQRQERVERQQVVQQDYSGGVQQCFQEGRSLYQGLCNVAQNYGYQSPQWEQACDHVRYSAPTQSSTIINKVSTNVNVQVIVKGGKDKIICLPVNNPTGTGGIIDVGPGIVTTPVGGNGGTVLASASKPNGRTGRNQQAALANESQQMGAVSIPTGTGRVKNQVGAAAVPDRVAQVSPKPLKNQTNRRGTASTNVVAPRVPKANNFAAAQVGRQNPAPRSSVGKGMRNIPNADTFRVRQASNGSQNRGAGRVQQRVSQPAYNVPRYNAPRSNWSGGNGGRVSQPMPQFRGNGGGQSGGGRNGGGGQRNGGNNKRH